MGLIISPEVRMARRILNKHNLSIPFNLDDLVSQYAHIRYEAIPIEGIDGVCLNLKKPGKRPIVIVNNNAAATRQKFTLAHELGHIIIPWHLGTIIDDIQLEENDEPIKDEKYWIFEREANRFASELLMPINYILDQFIVNPNKEFLVEKIKIDCGVSGIAATIRINTALIEIIEILISEDKVKEIFAKTNNPAQIHDFFVKKTSFNSLSVARHITKYLPGKIAYCVEEDGIVKGCGGTNTTYVYYQPDGQEFQANPYPHFYSYSVNNIIGIRTHWWMLDIQFTIAEDTREWRDILDKIVYEINPIEGADKLKKSINGKISGLNSQRKNKEKYADFDQFLAEVIHRFNSNEYSKLVKHPDFLTFLKKRASDLFKK